VTGWNNKVKECKIIEFSGKVFVLIEEKTKDPEEQGEFFVVDREAITEEAFRYLKSFVESSDSLLHEDISAADDESEEVQNLKALISDLRQDRIQLQHELD